MPSLISPTERENLTGIFNDIFDTFHRRIVVYKEPTKVRTSYDPSNMVFGFGEQQTEEPYTYTQVTGVFPATIRYKQGERSKFASDIDALIPANGVSIKVRPDCRDFINDGKTEQIEVDGRIFKLDSEERKQAFLDSNFYVFILKAVK
jgi:hypothetical protein